MKENTTVRATVEVNLIDGTFDCIPCRSAQVALISALTLVSARDLRDKIADICVYSGEKCIFHKYFGD